MVDMRVTQESLDRFEGMPVCDQARCKRPASRVTAVAHTEARCAVQPGDVALQAIGSPIFQGFAIETNATLYAQFERAAFLREDETGPRQEASVFSPV